MTQTITLHRADTGEAFDVDATLVEWLGRSKECDVDGQFYGYVRVDDQPVVILETRSDVEALVIGVQPKQGDQVGFMTILNSAGVLKIADERNLQRARHRAQDDDAYRDFELTRGALAYLTAALQMQRMALGEMGDGAASIAWPWAPETFRPRNAKRALEKAGAMIAAELDRLARAESTTKEG
jgi:hypothetical protein